MSQIFHPSTNTLSRLSLVGALGTVAAVGWLGAVGLRSTYVTEVGVARAQPVPFSHKHHVGGLGLDCRYCHTSVEDAAFAGIPATTTCMTCHSQIWTDSPMLALVQDSLRTDQSIAWTRVHDVADFVYFDHSIHVQKGVGCVSCHGRVDQMPLLWREHSLYMEWCLDCHRQPERFVRPREAVFQMDWPAADDQLALGQTLVRTYQIQTKQLTDCSICHR